MLTCLLYMLLLLLPANGASAEEHPLQDWSGLREPLEQRGLDLDMVYTGELVRNFDPGPGAPRRETIYQDNFDVEATLDTERAGLWPGGTFFVYGLHHGGFLATSQLGMIQGVSSIEAERHQFILYEAWYEQRFAAGRASLLAGLRDLNSDFYRTSYALLYLNSSFGIGPEVSANVPTALYTRAGLGVRLRYASDGGWYAQAGVFDGNPASRRISGAEGEMYIAETGVRRGSNSLAAGSWLHRARKDFAGRSYGRDYGVYGLGEYELCDVGGGSLGGFVQLGWVPKQRNAITRYVGVGLNLIGALPFRPEDRLGLATANAFTHAGTEHVIELTWLAPLMPGVEVQPSMQWIINPGGVVAASTIRMALLRFVVSL